MNLVSLAIPTFMLFNYAVNPVFAPDSAPYEPTNAAMVEAPKPIVTAAISKPIVTVVASSKQSSRPEEKQPEKIKAQKHTVASAHKAKLTVASLKQHSKTPAKSKLHVAAAHKPKLQVVASSGHTKHGTASWYGKGFQGKRTANGERFDMYSLTAAHKTLPLSSYVQVTNLKNNRSVIVRINDRGPYHSNREMDLSYAAAKQLGIHSTGTGSISITPVALK